LCGINISPFPELQHLISPFPALQHLISPFPALQHLISPFPALQHLISPFPAPLLPFTLSKFFICVHKKRVMSL
jgi:hypothetical protein